ncbi:hypothetical protein Ancab_006174 [Ancistrocladus abbreviatus]
MRLTISCLVVKWNRRINEQSFASAAVLLLPTLPLINVDHQPITVVGIEMQSMGGKKEHMGRERIRLRGGRIGGDDSSTNNGANDEQRDIDGYMRYRAMRRERDLIYP